ncbi:MAG: universal stress protein [Vicingaceae bacterium]|nr:universal stress protein [Vicingaceae bacterium]
MKTILLPTDFSDNAKNAIRYAIELYKNQEVNFILLNAYHPTHDDMANTITGGSLNDLLNRASEKQLQELINEIKINYNYNKYHAFSYKSAFGSLVEILKRFTEKHPVDLIVLGAKGMSAVEKIVFGSNTYAVIKEIDCPALVIPDNTLFVKPANIGIATDFKELKNKAIFSVLKSIKEDYQPKITLFNVTEEDKSITEKESIFTESIANLLEIEHLSADYFKNEDVIFGTNDFVNQRNINLLVLINKKRSFLQNLFHISFTKQIAFHAEVPILVLHD